MTEEETARFITLLLQVGASIFIAAIVAWIVSMLIDW